MTFASGGVTFLITLAESSCMDLRRLCVTGRCQRNDFYDQRSYLLKLDGIGTRPTLDYICYRQFFIHMT